MKAKWLVIGLVASLALNLALVGFLVGTESGPPPWHRGAFEPVAGLPRLMGFLPKERRQELMEQHPRRRLRESLRDMRRAQRAMDAALAEEPFDAEALSTALARYRRHFADSQASSHAAFVAIAAQLTPQERRRFVESLRRRGDGRRSTHGRRAQRVQR